MKRELTAEEFDKCRRDLPTTLGYYQATVTMMSIFLGFSFAALLQVLMDRRVQAYSGLVTVLVFSLALFMVTLVFLALSTHQVFRCWTVFFPVSWHQRIGSLAMSFGMLMMVMAVSWLLFHERMVIRAWSLLVFGVVLIAWAVIARKVLRGQHWIDVSGVKPMLN